MSNLVTLMLSREEAEAINTLLKQEHARGEEFVKRVGAHRVHPQRHQHQRMLSMVTDRIEFNMSEHAFES